jgi:hypothetical protein
MNTRERIYVTHARHRMGQDDVPSLHTSEELWRLIVRLANALERFTPRTPSRKFKLWPGKEGEELSYDSPQECYDTLCHRVKWLVACGHNCGSINEGFRTVYRSLILATTYDYWLLTELRSRTDPDAKLLRSILVSMQGLLIDSKHLTLTHHDLSGFTRLRGRTAQVSSAASLTALLTRLESGARPAREIGPSSK